MLLTAVLVLKVFFFKFIKVSGWITYRVFFQEEQLFAFIHQLERVIIFYELPLLGLQSQSLTNYLSKELRVLLDHFIP